MTDAKKIANKLNLLPHPEGGYYKETYRSSGVINQENLGNDFLGERHYSTCIYFLLTSDTFSAFHRIKQDEIWHFYKGTAIKLHIISAKGLYNNVVIGNDLEKGELPQYVVNAGDWFAAEVISSNAYTLLGCTVSPGFDFKDFELAERHSLTQLFPEHQDIILKLTRI
ncbi:cupin domain-containing protein [uncultured Algibacter sp.]|uniref:cupin domain-containing protein n=1 Tax=uncultured Algibacter sp. TaxID=298659 RepID=UPI00262DBB78|nr:cupin domain-containing protein [uncultured Algibacter sp.]